MKQNFQRTWKREKIVLEEGGAYTGPYHECKEKASYRIQSLLGYKEQVTRSEWYQMLVGRPDLPG